MASNDHFTLNSIFNVQSRLYQHINANQKNLENTFARVNINNNTNNNSPITITNPKHNLQAELLGSIAKIRQRYTQQLSIKNILDQKPQNPQQLQQKINNMSIIIQMISQQNKTFYKQLQNYDKKIKSQQEQIDIKDQMIKKYRQELLECRNTNMELKNYGRVVANQYNILLNSVQDKQSVSVKEVNVHKKRVAGLQGKVQFLRQRNRQISLKNIQNLKDKPYLQYSCNKCQRQNLNTMKTQFTSKSKNKKKNQQQCRNKIKICHDNNNVCKSNKSLNKPRRMSNAMTTTTNTARKSEFKIY